MKTFWDNHSVVVIRPVNGERFGKEFVVTSPSIVCNAQGAGEVFYPTEDSDLNGEDLPHENEVDPDECAPMRTPVRKPQDLSFKGGSPQERRFRRKHKRASANA